jgi:hypothetical protein
MTRPEVTPNNKFYSTKEFAELLRIGPNTIRRSLCVNGHYLGVRPVKLANRRLVWPAGPAEQLMCGK